MCGIVGYIGSKQAKEILLDGLRRLEYRGYDSAGLALIEGGKLLIFKRAGKVADLEGQVAELLLNSTIGIGHCLAPDTLIQLADGQVIPIAEMESGMMVLSLDPSSLQFIPQPARVSRHRAPKELLEIRTDSTKITCSPAHRMLTVDTATGEIGYCRAEELKQGDLLLLARGLPHPPHSRSLAFAETYPRRYWRLSSRVAMALRQAALGSGLPQITLAREAGLSLPALRHLLTNDRHARETYLEKLCATLDLPFPPPGAQPIHSHHGKFVRLPSRSSPELMKLLGYLLGDGHIHERSVRWKDQRREVLEHYQELAGKLFGLEGRLVPLHRVGAWLLEINSLELVRWLRCNFLAEQGLWNRISRLPEPKLAGFLRGLFDAEGFIAWHAGQVALRMVNEGLVRRVQLWLLRFGIISSLYTVPPSPQHRRPRPMAGLALNSREALEQFARHIGFSSPEKQSQLERLISRKRKGFTISTKVIPIKKPYLLQQLIALGVPRAKVRPFRGHGYLTAAQSQRLLELLAAYPQAEPLRERLQRYLSGQISFQEVRSICWVPTPEEFVYDLEVARTENFIANGLISHNSRWATHGRPTDENAHPHSDCQGRLAVIHNGIIENYLQLKEELQAKGHKFASQTDTEVLAHLFEEHYHGDLEEAVRAGLKRVKGAFAIAVIAEDSEEIVAARIGSPLVIGLGEEENFLASDIPAILPYTREMLFLNDGEMAVLTAEAVKLSTFTGERVAREPLQINWDPVTAQKGGYKHFMLKEIHEQPQAVEDTIRGRYSLEEGKVFLQELNLTATSARRIRNVYFLACGTSAHAGLVAKYLWQEWLRLPIAVELGSEFRYSNPYIDKDTLVVAISQSGETADTLAGVRKAKEHGAMVIAIANVVGSSITREADGVVYTHAGPEIGVASTKAFTAQLAALTLLGVHLGRERGELSVESARQILSALAAAPRYLERVSGEEERVQELARNFYAKKDFLYLGRDILHPIALEGALKLKEISYIHAEGYAAGEMKHGPIALIDEEMPVVVLVTKNSVYDKVFANIEEVKARKGIVIAFTDEVNRDIARIADQIFEIPYTPAVLTPMLFVVPLQLLAYHIGVLRGTDVDQPRNLAKSVTVE